MALTRIFGTKEPNGFAFIVGLHWRTNVGIKWWSGKQIPVTSMSFWTHDIKVTEICFPDHHFMVTFVRQWWRTTQL